MTMRIPHGNEMFYFLDKIMPRFSLVSIHEQFCLLEFAECKSSTEDGQGALHKTISLYRFPFIAGN